MTTSDAWFGPVALTLYEPQLTDSVTPTAFGIRTATITGQAEWTKAHQLHELVNNPARRVTIGGQTGVLEVAWFSDDLLGPLTGFALFQSFQLGQADQSHSVNGTTGLVPYTLTAAFIGSNRTVVLTRSTRAKAHTYSLTPQALVAAPFWDATGGSGFVKSPGGSPLTREYDASFPHSTARVSPPAADDRQLPLFAAAFTTTDPFPLVLLPKLAQSPTGPPAWVTDRGSDCRAYDRREEREVYGPHPFVQTTDLKVTNGLLTAWVGVKGQPPSLNVQGFSGGSHRQPGTVNFGTSGNLLGARLVSVTPEEITIALVVDGQGDLFVTLRRGELMFRTTLPSIAQRPAWKGTPLPTLASAAANGAGRFGLGLDGGGGGSGSTFSWDGTGGTWAEPWPTWGGGAVEDPHPGPSLRLKWPADVSKNSWASAFWFRTAVAASSSTGSGLLDIIDSLGAIALQFYLDPADHKIKVSVGGTVLASSVQTYSIGEDLLFGISFSTVTGLALAIYRAVSDSIEYVTNASALNPGTIADYAEIVYHGVTSITADAYSDTYSDTYTGTMAWGAFNPPYTVVLPGGVIDNHMVFDGPLTKAEYLALGRATNELDGLPVPEARLRWYAPFDVAPITDMSAESNGLSTDHTIDAAGFQKALVALSADHLDMAVGLARTETFDTAADLRAQLATETDQSVRVR